MVIAEVSQLGITLMPASSPSTTTEFSTTHPHRRRRRREERRSQWLAGADQCRAASLTPPSTNPAT
jgi:hypothetical protein